MTRMTLAVLVRVLAATVCAGPAWADDAVRLTPSRVLVPGFESLPRVVDGVPAPARARINGALAAADKRGMAARTDCLAQQDPAEPSIMEWTRAVTVTQAGPRWLAVLVSDEMFCGGAHPDADVFPLVFDVRTGRPPDWTRLLPRSLAGEAVLSTAGDGTRIGLVRSAALLRRAVAQAPADCKAILDRDAGQFAVWPGDGRLNAVVFGLPHVAAACADAVGLTPAELRGLGASDLAVTIAPGRKSP